MSKYEFLHSTPNDIILRMEIKQDELEEHAKEIEYQSWLTGAYVREAIISALSVKKKIKYPENPIEVRSKTTKEIAKKSGKSEQQIQQELAYYSLRVKQANANIAQARQDRLAEIQGG